MKNLNKILSLLLAAVMLLGCLTTLTVTASADEVTTAGESTEEKKKEVNYLTDVFATPDDKLATMKLKLTKGNYQLYADSYTGEVAVKNTVTGQILSTNPYDVGTATSSDSIKYQLLDMKNDDEYNTFILMFTVKNQAGTLAKAIAVMGEYGYSMRVLRSRPMKSKNWQYYFYVEGQGCLVSEKGNTLIESLKAECEEVKVLGHYSGECNI